MELEEMMALVERSWQFVPANYPVLKRINKDQRRAFAVSHILKHQLKSIDALERLDYKSSVGPRPAPTLEEVTDFVRKILHNSLRLAQVVDSSFMTETIGFELNCWKTIPKEKVQLEFSQKRGEIGLKFELASLKNHFIDGTVRSEQLDNGDFAKFEPMGKVAVDFIKISLMLACRFALSREDFQAWLAENVGAESVPR